MITWPNALEHQELEGAIAFAVAPRQRQDQSGVVVWRSALRHQLQTVQLRRTNALAPTPREHAVLSQRSLPRKNGRQKDLVDSLFTLEDTVSGQGAGDLHRPPRKKIENSGAKIITLRGLDTTC